MATLPTLTAEQLAAWRADGWLHLEGVLGADRVAELDSWVQEVAGWAEHHVAHDDDGPGLHHFEQTDRGPVIARSERFADAHHGLGSFLRSGVIVEVLEQLFGEPAVLFKEKVNYKHPGGAGFAPHQDAVAYRFVDHHISVMVPLDPATVASGCLHLAPGHRRGTLETDARGRVAEAVAATLAWRPVEVAPGDLLFFDSYAPHRSDTNTSDRPRRALYLTYNAASKGDHRARYYDDKQAELDREGATFTGERVRMSIIDDFLGRPVQVPDAR